jgi:hypothetical protein
MSNYCPQMTGKIIEYREPEGFWIEIGDNSYVWCDPFTSSDVKKEDAEKMIGKTVRFNASIYSVIPYPDTWEVIE